MTTDSRGLYVHIPFCVRKCNYCDFASFGCSSIDWRERYIDALCGEILSYRDKSIGIDSIFFGGGTPSLLTPSEFERIVSAIAEGFNVFPNTEFTLEVNPKTVDEEKLASYVRYGVNRLSIGLQSIHENEQKILGRIHNFDDFLKTYYLARKSGIKNINVDLMYGIPEQTMESFGETLRRVTDLSPEHISLYGLILEEETPFYRIKDKLPLPTEDTECDMYYLAANKLSAAGYSHYEISNYAKEGYECRHNLKYWHCEEYIGVGLSAYSYFDGARFGNSDSIEEYLGGSYAKYSREDKLDKDALAYEYVMLAFRLKEGFSLDEYKVRFDRDFLEGRADIIDRFEKVGYLINRNGRIALTESGFYVSNSILTELL